MSAAFSAIINVGASVFPEGSFGIIDASTTRKCVTPFTLLCEKTIVILVYNIVMKVCCISALVVFIKFWEMLQKDYLSAFSSLLL